MSESPLIGIVVLNWNNYEDTAECLNGLRELEYSPVSVVVVDNGSTDSSAERLASEFPNVTHINRTENGGFGVGCNDGIKHLLQNDAEYIWLLNNDTEPAEIDGGVETIISHMESVPDCGIVSPKILYSPDKDRIWFEKGTINWKVGIGVHESYEGTQLVHEDNEYVPFCAPIIRREVFERVGLLPEDYFLYLEDIDYCVDVRESGFEIATHLGVTVPHRVSSSIGSAFGPVASYYVARNSILFARQHLSLIHRRFPLTHTWWTVSRMLYRLFHGHTNSANAWIQGVYDSIRGRRGKGPYPE